MLAEADFEHAIWPPASQATARRAPSRRFCSANCLRSTAPRGRRRGCGSSCGTRRAERYGGSGLSGGKVPGSCTEPAGRAGRCRRGRSAARAGDRLVRRAGMPSRQARAGRRERRGGSAATEAGIRLVGSKSCYSAGIELWLLDGLARRAPPASRGPRLARAGAGARRPRPLSTGVPRRRPGRTCRTRRARPRGHRVPLVRRRADRCLRPARPAGFAHPAAAPGAVERPQEGDPALPADDDVERRDRGRALPVDQYRQDPPQTRVSQARRAPAA